MMFKEKVLYTMENVLKTISGDQMYLMAKPIINLAKPQIKQMLEKEPKVIYDKLVIAQKEIKELMEVYENEFKE